MSTRRIQLIEEIAAKYYDFLKKLNYNDEVFMQGISEGKRKFLSNTTIYVASRDLPSKNLLYTTDFISPDALKIITTCKSYKTFLTYEHIVPKGKYIQNECERLAIEDKLQLDFVIDILDRYLWTATITKEENSLLLKNTMPPSWDKKNIHARYEHAGITLLPHDTSYLYEDILKIK